MSLGSRTGRLRGADRRRKPEDSHRKPQKTGDVSLLTIGAFSLAVELLCLQSVQVLVRCIFPLLAKKLNCR